MIEAQSLTKVYGGTTAVDGIDFQAKPGLVTGFLGPNGAGKSTTMRKLGVRDRLQAAVAAYDAGLVRPHGS
jgi:ABC-2 type transport system ATP-binding protein